LEKMLFTLAISAAILLGFRVKLLKLHSAWAQASVSLPEYSCRRGAPYLLFHRGLNIFHTGMNSLLNAILNKADITVTILDNRITAMTGHQPNPGVGFTATGEKTIQVSLAELCKAMGAEFVSVVDPYKLEETQKAFQAAKEFKGTAVVIATQSCVISEKRAGINGCHISLILKNAKAASNA